MITFPGTVESLRVAVGIRRPFPRDESEQLGTRWPRIELEGGLLVDDCELHVNRRAPALLGLLRRSVPAGLFLEDLADVLDVLRRRGAAARNRKQDQCRESGRGPGFADLIVPKHRVSDRERQRMSRPNRHCNRSAPAISSIGRN